MMHADGGLTVAAVAQRAGVPCAPATLATNVASGHRGRDEHPAVVPAVRVAPPGLREGLVARARQAGYRALVLRVDNPVRGGRVRDLRNGLTIAPALTLRTLVDGARHPRLWWGLPS